MFSNFADDALVPFFEATHFWCLDMETNNENLLVNSPILGATKGENHKRAPSFGRSTKRQIHACQFAHPRHSHKFHVFFPGLRQDDVGLPTATDRRLGTNGCVFKGLTKWHSFQTIQKEVPLKAQGHTHHPLASAGSTHAAIFFASSISKYLSHPQ